MEPIKSPDGLWTLTTDQITMATKHMLGMHGADYRSYPKDSGERVILFAHCLGFGMGLSNDAGTDLMRRSQAFLQVAKELVPIIEVAIDVAYMEVGLP